MVLEPPQGALNAGTGLTELRGTALYRASFARERRPPEIGLFGNGSLKAAEAVAPLGEGCGVRFSPRDLIHDARLPLRQRLN